MKYVSGRVQSYPEASHQLRPWNLSIVLGFPALHRAAGTAAECSCHRAARTVPAAEPQGLPKGSCLLPQLVGSACIHPLWRRGWGQGTFCGPVLTEV